LERFVIKGVKKVDVTSDPIPEDVVYEVALIIRDPEGIDQNTGNRKELAEAIRLICEVADAN